MLECYNECRLLQKEVLEVEGLYREGVNSCIDNYWRMHRSVHPHTVQNLLLYSPLGLDPRLAKRALKDSLK